MSCCNFDNDILFEKIKNLEKNVKKFEREQNKTNAEIYTLLKQSGVDLSQYYALNEEDYTKVLTSEDDINTLEPGTYKIVKEDMPQNAPTGVASSEDDGTLIQSNSYALFKMDLMYYRTKTSDETWTEWKQVAFLSDVPSLDGYATENWVNQQIQDITGGSVTADWVKNNFYALANSQYKKIPENTDYNTLTVGSYYGKSTNFTNTNISSIGGNILLIKFNTDSSHFRSIIYKISNNRMYFCNSTATIVSQIAYLSDIPSLSGYATQSWVQSQNYLTEIPDNYTTDMEVTQAITTALIGYATQTWVNQQGFAKETDIPSLSGYATQTWVNQQGFLTEIPEEYITQTELQAQNYATQSWVTARGYQTSAQVDAAITEALNGYATETWTKSNFYSLNKDLYSIINSNDDLNDYTEPGTYLSVNSETTTTLSNKPTGLKYSFKLIVEEISDKTYFIQRIIENITANCYIRSCSGGNFNNWKEVVFTSDLTNYATEEWVGQQGYQTVQQVNSLINTATADMLTQADLDTFNYATENWVLQTALAGYAKTTIDDSLATRPSQEFDRFMIRSTDYHGVNAVSGAEGYLVMHMAVDPDSPTKFIRSSGIVANNKYVNTFSTSDGSSVGLSTNNEGTVTVVGMSNNAKQMFILVKPDNME